MPEDNYFYVIDQPRETTIKIRRSIFTCRLEPVDSIEAAKAFISSVAKENKTATHNCWAYILGDRGETFHSSDAGEPAGTAGKPMLNTLQSGRMTGVAAVVTRYFGGVKLGVRGLIEAYAESVRSAMDLAPLKKRVQIVSYDVTLDYAFNDTFLARIKPYLVRVADTAYTQDIVHRIEVELPDRAGAEQVLADCRNQGKLNFTFVE